MYFSDFLVSYLIIIQFSFRACSFWDFVYLFDRERHSERGNAGRGRGGGGLPAGRGAGCGARSHRPGVVT